VICEFDLDVVLMDYWMFGVSGIEVIRWIKDSDFYV